MMSQPVTSVSSVILSSVILEHCTGAGLAAWHYCYLVCCWFGGSCWVCFFCFKKRHSWVGCEGHTLHMWEALSHPAISGFFSFTPIPPLAHYTNTTSTAFVMAFIGCYCGLFSLGLCIICLIGLVGVVPYVVLPLREGEGGRGGWEKKQVWHCSVEHCIDWYCRVINDCHFADPTIGW